MKDFLSTPDLLPGESSLFARRPWSEDADAVVAKEDQQPPGYDYLLETELVREVLAVWSEWRDGRSPTPSEAARAVMHYAELDAYLPVAEDE